MHLALHSSHEHPGDLELNRLLFRALGLNTPKVGYIPSDDHADQTWFLENRELYAKLGASLGPVVTLTETVSDNAWHELLSCDAIHLAGGDTFDFLARARKHNLEPRLRTFLARGGALIGVSAGSILMTPDILTAAICGDPVPVGPFNSSSFAFVDFLFVPHFDGTDEMLEESQTEATSQQRSLFLCPDGSGILITQGSIQTFGNPIRLEP
jgi:dipeptidase E